MGEPVYYSQLGKTELAFYDGLPIGSILANGTANTTAATMRSTIIAETDITSGPSFTFKGSSNARALLRNVAEPVATTDAATKYYVDSVASGLTVKGAVKVRTMAPIPMSPAATGGATYGASAAGLANSQISGSVNGSFGLLLATLFDIDARDTDTLQDVNDDGSFTYTASTDETIATRFLVMNQAEKRQNGVYYLAEAGSVSEKWKLLRSTNFNDDPSGEIKAGSFVFVTSGKTHKNHGFVLIADGAATILQTRLVGAAANELNFEQFSGAGQLKGGDNIEITGDTIALKKVVTGLTSVATGTITATGAAKLESTLDVSGAATLKSTLTVTDATDLRSTLTVSGLVTAKQGVSVTSGNVVVGTISPSRSENLQVGGGVYIAGDATLTGIINSSNAGRSVFSGSAIVGTYAASGVDIEPSAGTSSKLSVAGSVYANGDFAAKGASTLGGTLGVSGAITANETALFKKAVTAEDLMRSKTLIVDSTATITGATTIQSTLGVTGAANLESTLVVGAAATLKSSLVVSGDCTISGASRTSGTSRLVDRVEIGAPLTSTNMSLYETVSYAARGTSKLGVAGDAWVDGALRVMSSCELGNDGAAKVDVGVVPSTWTTIPDTRTNSKLRVAGGAFLDGALYVSGIASVGGSLSVTGAATVTGVSHLKSRTDIGTLPATDQSGAMLAVYGSLNVTGVATLRDQVRVGSALTVTQEDKDVIKSTVIPVKLLVNGRAYVEDDLVVNKDLQVAYDATFGDEVTVTGKTALGSAFVVVPAAGTLKATVSVTGDTTFTGSTNKTKVDTLFEVNNNSKFTGAVVVEETFTVGTSALTKASTMYGSLSVSKGDLTVDPGTSGAPNKLIAKGIGSEVGFIKFGKSADGVATMETSLTTPKTVSFVDNNITTTSDVTCKNVAATENITATKKGTFQEGCYSLSFYATSDARLKRDVNTVSDALEKCAQLRGVTFKWVAGEDQRDQLGVIAQETQLVFPSLVSEHEGYLRVDYPKLVGLLIEAVKELDVRTRPVASA